MASSLEIGTRLGPYEILSPLGAGGMGEVYRARDTRLGREVAIKVLPQHLSSDAEVRARFDREAKTVSSINHPHICTLFDVGREGTTEYLVMELIEGETLAHRLAKGPLPIDQVLAIGGQIADALSQAHRVGIVHRDLKPGNVMLTRSGAKLMDFGLARVAPLGNGSGVPLEAPTQSPTVAGPLTSEGSIVGTFLYMSPEQLEGKEADARSDVWALGCVLYEMVTGVQAFQGKSQASLIAAILERDPAPITDAQPMSPLALARLIKGCLAKDPDDRVQTAHDVKLQLAWMGADGSGSAPAPVVPTAARSSRARVFRSLASLSLLLAVAALAYVAGRRGAGPAGTQAGEFSQRTFHTQAIFAARFMPDSTTLVMSAALEGNRTELFVIRPEYEEPRSLGKKDVHLLAISSRGELAVLNNARFAGHHRLFNGTLARMPLEGAAPRELMEGVREADWAPDGAELAIIRDVDGSDRLEFPVGKVLYQASGYLSDIRFSPRGDLIAFMVHPWRFDDRGTVNVVDLSGKARELSGGYWGLEGMAWAPDGSAVYYSGAGAGGLYPVYRAGLDGDVRRVSDNAGAMTMHDVARDGTWAVTRDDTPTQILFRATGSGTDVDLSWLDSALSPVLSADGGTVVFTDQSRNAGPNYGVAMRPTSGGPIVRLGEGDAQELSGDGKTVLAIVPSTPPRIMSYPLGAGQAVQLDHGEFENLSQVSQLPGSTRLLVSGNIAGQPPRCFVFDPASGEVTPAGPEGIRNCRPSPDGKTFIASSQSAWLIYPLSGTGAGKTVGSMTPEDYLVRWNLDGSAVLVIPRNRIPAPVERVDLATGKRETVMMLSDKNSSGRVAVLSASMADDLRSIAYAAWNYRSVLFTATGKR